VREIRIEDAEAAARLSGEFGYPVSAEEMAGRILAHAALADHTTLVACLDEQVIGWIDVGITHHLQVEAYAEIGGLVVASTARSLGIGGQLLAWAEDWARARGVRRVVVRSQIARERAHRFYLERGYERTKTSAVFSKQVAG
jgi:GNAT superfamily N-acetyltransferase